MNGPVVCAGRVQRLIELAVLAVGLVQQSPAAAGSVGRLGALAQLFLSADEVVDLDLRHSHALPPVAVDLPARPDSFEMVAVTPLDHRLVCQAELFVSAAVDRRDRAGPRGGLTGLPGRGR